MNTPAFKRVALVLRPHAQKHVDILQKIIRTLRQQVQLVIEADTATQLPDTDLPVIPAGELNTHADLLLVIGGDGSMLHAAHMAISQKLPLLGINRGRLGFLADIPPHDTDQLTRVLNGNYQTELRFLLSATLKRDGQQSIALNDMVLSPGRMSQMVEFDIYINNKLMCHQRADGLIIATPTGSTAYALSAGGPIMHPSLSAITLVPMCPHKLSSRPIVIDSTHQISIEIVHNAHSITEQTPFFSSDGQDGILLKAGDRIDIQRLDTEIKLIHPTDYDYFATLRQKLGWERSS